MILAPRLTLRHEGHKEHEDHKNLLVINLAFALTLSVLIRRTGP